MGSRARQHCEKNDGRTDNMWTRAMRDALASRRNFDSRASARASARARVHGRARSRQTGVSVVSTTPSCAAATRLAQQRVE